ncbi:hypothetical protein [Aliarcobacter butzleri]|uniref:TPM domain-containing protein n=1 Tax=Aliarcobacter butzleri TaxID=28197 RepID=A0AAW6VIZ8_9BACT|nr:hypothetical protein [Aliarcobacter butzleri]MCG3715090.1 hypothetical protein [Aliarcobacter butzleri]MDK2041878.1 hypothetical protein [Aliarcobacter butzleri]MDK2097256.1 hypothetical protein [Aliarcobacter butzleri]MDN5088662.1 hypothetical protein [Aliarcobacter butzleri]MDN5098231.1 hypothetical protein [Aliarcobacter butzleri]
MKKVKFFKVGVIFSLLLFFCTNLNAENYILNDDKLIDDRAKEKINQIGDEVKSKLGVNIYIYAKSTLGLDDNIKTKEKIEIVKSNENQILQNLKAPYILMTIYVEENMVNLIFTEDFKNIIDKNDILDGYVVPLLASKDKNTLYAKVSAATLNGYAAIADTLADSKNIKLENSIGNSGKVSGTIWRVFMYTLVVVALLVYTYAVLRKRK